MAARTKQVAHIVDSSKRASYLERDPFVIAGADTIFDRIKKAGLSYGSAPWSLDDGELNDWNGGRGVYFKDPNGHQPTTLQFTSIVVCPASARQNPTQESHSLDILSTLEVSPSIPKLCVASLRSPCQISKTHFPGTSSKASSSV
jgi:hypothetical protein